MTDSYVEYGLQDGYLINWLAAGPQAVPEQDYSKKATNSDPQQFAAQFLEVKSSITNSAVERGPLNEGIFSVDGYKGEWNYYRCQEDHLVDLSTSFDTSHVVRAWAYTQLYSKVEQPVNFSLTTFGPIEVWINKNKIFRSEQSSSQPFTSTFTAPIKKGANRILVGFAGYAAPASILAFALKIECDTSLFQVRIPTLIPSIERRNELESVYDQLYLDRDIVAYGEDIILNWPEKLNKPAYNDARLQTLAGRIYGQAEEAGRPGQKLILGSSTSLMEGPYQAYVMPRAWEYYESHIRITRKLDLWVMGRNRFSATPYGSLKERQREALANAAARENQLFAEIARMALGNFGSLEQKVINQALAGISKCEVGSEVHLLGLLGAVIRYSSQPNFPSELNGQVREAALNFQYAPDQGGCEEHRFSAPDHQILIYACQILSGQLYPEGVFNRGQLIGTQQRQDGETNAIRWMLERGQIGFLDWDSRSRYASILTALSYLIDLSESEEVWELGSVLMDKMLFTIALNSFHGVYGSAQGYATSTDVKSGLLDPTSSITRLMWGQGIYNHHTAGTVSMACMSNYELPPIIADIANRAPDELLNREQQVNVNKVTYRTAAYMLSSAQDYRPGQPGEREHVWQATLGPQAIVFTNHPGCSTEHDAHVPNYWLGNGILPRVAQWNDTLVALYKIPNDAILEFTHAYFPTSEFDEYLLRGDTAFARKGNGYLALTSPNGIEMIECGAKAFRELRSYGNETSWICQMGQAATDGSFADFQEKVLALDHTFDGLEIQVQTLRGDELKFGWEVPLMINGDKHPLDGFKHYDNAYTTVELPCKEMEISTGEYLLRLQFDVMKPE
jgi:hypothetical protein